MITDRFEYFGGVVAPDGAFPSDLTADGRFVIYHNPSAHRGWDLWLLPTTERAKTEPDSANCVQRNIRNSFARWAVARLYF